MRNRTIGINVRVSENEKKKLQRNAKKSNLNLSSYLRKAGLQKEIISKINIPPEGIKDREKIIYAQIVVQLSNIMQYDFEGAKLINENKEIYYIDEERIDKTQNLKGLIEGKNVCKGNSTMINALAQYFGISSKSISSKEHAWNLVVLDGKTY